MSDVGRYVRWIKRTRREKKDPQKKKDRLKREKREKSEKRDKHRKVMQQRKKMFTSALRNPKQIPKLAGTIARDTAKGVGGLLGY